MNMRTNEDLVHEALLIIHAKYKNIEFDRGILPWAYVILDKVMSGDYRTKKRRQNIMNNNRNEVLKLHEDIDSVEDDINSLELFNEVWSALSQLSNKEKKIFELKLKGHSSEEILQELGISRTTLDVTVFRGRKKLKHTLEKRGIL